MKMKIKLVYVQRDILYATHLTSKGPVMFRSQGADHPKSPHSSVAMLRPGRPRRSAHTHTLTLTFKPAHHHRHLHINNKPQGRGERMRLTRERERGGHMTSAGQCLNLECSIASGKQEAPHTCLTKKESETDMCWNGHPEETFSAGPWLHLRTAQKVL